MEEKYGPEDIEQLLLSKDFSELYPEERAYVLRHMEDEAEYNAMRLMLSDISLSEDDVAPPLAMRDALVSLHESRHKTSNFKIWLNSILAVFAFPEQWKRPAFQLAGVVGGILVIVFVFRVITPSLNTGELAHEPNLQEQVNPKTKQESEPASQSNSESLIENKDEKPIVTKESNSYKDVGNNLATQPTLDEKTEEIESNFKIAPSAVFDTDVVAIVEDDIAMQEEEILVEEYEEEMTDEEVFVSAERKEASDEFNDLEVSPEPADMASKSPTSSVSVDALSMESDKLLKTSTAVPQELINHLYTAW